jgi:N-acetylneuraminate synthase
LDYINLNYLDTLKDLYGITGLSDHGKDNDVIIGAVAKGAEYIERHFTDDPGRGYPDHYFSLNPVEFKFMVDRVRHFERTLGDGVKKVQDNEQETHIIQRRAWYATRDIERGQRLEREDIIALRPCSREMVPASMDIVGDIALYDIKAKAPIWYIDLFEQCE